MRTLQEVRDEIHQIYRDAENREFTTEEFMKLEVLGQEIAEILEEHHSYDRE